LGGLRWKNREKKRNLPFGKGKEIGHVTVTDAKKIVLQVVTEVRITYWDYCGKKKLVKGHE